MGRPRKDQPVGDSAAVHSILYFVEEANGERWYMLTANGQKAIAAHVRREGREVALVGDIEGTWQSREVFLSGGQVFNFGPAGRGRIATNEATAIINHALEPLTR